MKCRPTKAHALRVSARTKGFQHHPTGPFAHLLQNFRTSDVASLCDDKGKQRQTVKPNAKPGRLTRRFLPPHSFSELRIRWINEVKTVQTSRVVKRRFWSALQRLFQCRHKSSRRVSHKPKRVVALPRILIGSWILKKIVNPVPRRLQRPKGLRLLALTWLLGSGRLVQLSIMMLQFFTIVSFDSPVNGFTKKRASPHQQATVPTAQAQYAL